MSTVAPSEVGSEFSFPTDDAEVGGERSNEEENEVAGGWDCSCCGGDWRKYR
jgi:hypothetical protein